MDFLLDTQLYLTVFSGFLIGFLINLTGVGGGVLLVPVLTLIFKLEISVAVGTASIFVTLTKIYATFEHIKLKTIHYRSSAFLLSGAIVGVLIAGGLVNYFLSQNLSEEETAAIQLILRQITIGAIFFSTVLIFLEKVGIFNKLKSKISQTYEKILLVIFGFIIGLVMGATGIGGGVLIFPTFFLITRLKSKEIIGSSIFIALVVSGITALLYSGGGQADYRMAIWLTVGSFLGVFVASKMIKKVSNQILDYVIIGLIFCSGIIMIMTR